MSKQTPIVYILYIYSDATKQTIVSRQVYFDTMEAAVKADDMERAGWNVELVHYVPHADKPSPNGKGGSHGGKDGDGNE